MTKSVVPTPAAGNSVVEMDAIDVKEWEHGQRTPQASDANLAALVKQSGESGAESAAHRSPAIPAISASPGPASAPLASGSSARPALPPVPDPGRRGGPAMGPLPGDRAGTAPPVARPGTRAGGALFRPGTAPSVLPALRTGPASVPSLAAVRSAGPAPDVASASAPAVAAAPPAASSGMGAGSPGRLEPTKPADPPVRPGSPNLPFVLRGSAPVLSEPPAKLAFRAGRPGSQPPAEVPLPRAAPALEETVVLRSPPATESFEELTVRRPAWPGSQPLEPGSFTGGGPPAAAWIDQTAPGRPKALARPGAVSFDEPTRVVRVPSAAAPAPAGPESAALPAPVEAGRSAYPNSAGSFNDVPSFAAGDSTLGDRRTPSRVSHPSVDRQVSADLASVQSIAPSRRLLAWTAAGCVAIVAAIVLLGGGSAGSTATAVSAPQRAVRDHDERAQVAAAAASADERVRAAAAAASADEPAAAPPVDRPDRPARAIGAPTTPLSEVAPAVPMARPRRLGGKKVVVEYIDHGSDAPGLVAQDDEDPAIARARAAYLGGNRKLFAGDVAGAIAAYQESLALYPGYVGGYRGLGLAYAQRGDRENALAALQTYVTTVPSAKDVGLIKKRIARLQGK